MPAPNPKTYHMSASSIAAFKTCPQKFRLAYREGLRKIEDTESQRMGTNWHRLHEIYATGDIDAVVAHLNETYKDCPQAIDITDWAVEQQILLNSFLGYQLHWQNDPYEVLASEVPFEFRIKSPKTGLPLPKSQVVCVGKIDHIIRWGDAVCILERKSTSRSIDPSGDYWEKVRKDTQISMYSLAARTNEYFQDGSDSAWGNILYDVWKKPTIKPKMLTQAESQAFVTTGAYCGRKFVVISGCDASSFDIEGESALVEPGKKGFAIRETPQMFGARLLADIAERPDFYFQRKEIARTDAELRAFEKSLYAVYQAQQAFEREAAWFENETQCRATYPCPFIPICYGPGADAVCDGKTSVNNYKRIFVDLTIKGEPVDD